MYFSPLNTGVIIDNKGLLLMTLIYTVITHQNADTINHMNKVAVLGTTGMLGSTITRHLENEKFHVTEFNRKGVSVTGNNNFYSFDALHSNKLHELLGKFHFDYVINCVGIIRQLIDEKKQDSIELAIKINSEFPMHLNQYSVENNVPVITIGTDCVYSGKVGSYSEIDLFDPIDQYGITKVAGENASKDAMTIRCSIIGKEINQSNSLLEWILSKPRNSSVNGFINHIWNGVTTLQFSQVVSGIMQNNDFMPGTVHLVPKNVVDKYELLKIIVREFGRNDIKIHKFKADFSVDRSLTTIDSLRNLRFWRNAGYNVIPSIEEMVSAYQSWKKLND
jgi:dTDP-4-dehydrorhamnose reductase